MHGRAVYLDTSAFLKLLVTEAESKALQRYLRRWSSRVSAALLSTETIRALRRAGYDSLVVPAQRLLAGVHLIQLDEPLLTRAAGLDSRSLRTLDAVHLAAALTIGSDLEAFVAYDERLSDAAQRAGLTVTSPG